MSPAGTANTARSAIRLGSPPRAAHRRRATTTAAHTPSRMQMA